MTTLPRPNLKREIGVTKVSLENGDRLLRSCGKPIHVRIVSGGNTGDVVVRVTYAPYGVHVFSGFSVGYGGEGPRGLARWCEANDVPLRMRDVVQLDPSLTGDLWAFHRASGEVWRQSKTRTQGMEF